MNHRHLEAVALEVAADESGQLRLVFDHHRPETGSGAATRGTPCR